MRVYINVVRASTCDLTSLFPAPSAAAEIRKIVAAVSVESPAIDQEINRPLIDAEGPMEVRDQNLSVFYMNRLFGLAPFELIRNQKGILVGFRTGKVWYGYSVALIAVSGTCLVGPIN